MLRLLGLVGYRPAFEPKGKAIFHPLRRLRAVMRFEIFLESAMGQGTNKDLRPLFFSKSPSLYKNKLKPELHRYKSRKDTQDDNRDCNK
jgi:hypothetical protein